MLLRSDLLLLYDVKLVRVLWGEDDSLRKLISQGCEVGDGDKAPSASLSAELPLPEELLYWGEAATEPGEVVLELPVPRHEDVPLVFDCCLE